MVLRPSRASCFASRHTRCEQHDHALKPSSKTDRHDSGPGVTAFSSGSISLGAGPDQKFAATESGSCGLLVTETSIRGVPGHD